MKSLVSMLAVAAFLTSGAAMAADPPSNTGAAGKPKIEKMHKMKKHHEASVQSDVSKKCSAEATAKNLHGKERKAFRKQCMKTASPA